jgi:hypothetical protein
MRTVLLFAILHITVVVTCAQVDTSRTAVVDTSAVVNQNTLYSQELPKDIGPAKDSVRVAAAALPARLRRRLKREEQYKGWEGSEFYLDRVNGLYKVYFTDGARVREYVFDNKGNPVTVNSFVRRKN